MRPGPARKVDQTSSRRPQTTAKYDIGNLTVTVDDCNGQFAAGVKRLLLTLVLGLETYAGFSFRSCILEPWGSELGEVIRAM